ncbi:MAG: NAD-dependent epimerase/dehydratase family protein, partial [Gammaproteobacteria bacterium]|nr:NAD-dependent epimerase/dehydratase family protein [Gammaproteobacteria bacterium]
IIVVTSSQYDASNLSLGGNCEVFAFDSLQSDLNLTDAMQNVDVVIHLAARVHVMNDTDPDPLSAFRKANVEWTKQLVEAAVAANVKRFIFVSSLHVLGSESSNHPFDENDNPKPPSSYAISKLEAEEYLNDVANKNDMEIVIIRPPLVYGPKVKANFLSLLKLTKTGLPLPAGLLNNKRSMISVNNLVDFIICCIEHPKAANETFLISDDNDVSTKNLFFKLIKLFGKRPLLLPIPSKLLYVLGLLLGKKDIVERLCAPLQIDITKAKTLLGWKPVQTLDDGLKEAVEWYKKEQSC